MSYELLNRLFELRKGQISKAVETSNGYFIAKVTEKENAYIPDYDEAREAVKDKILRQSAMEIAEEKAKEVLPVLQEEYTKTLPLDFAKAAKNLSLTIEQSPIFNRGQYLPKIGISKTFQEAAFELSEDEPISDPVATQNGYYIIHLDEYIPASKEDYDLQKDSIAAFVLNSNKAEMFAEFISRLRIESNLIDNVTEAKQERKGS